MISNIQKSRRNFLTNIGFAMLALPLRNIIYSDSALGATLGTKRALFVYMPTGAIDFWPAGESRDLSQVDASYFPSTIQDLSELKNDLILFKGISHYNPTGGASPNNHFEAYAPGLALPFSGAYGGPSHVFAGGGGYFHLDPTAQLSGRQLESLDQYLLRKNPGIKSLSLGYNTTHPTSINSFISFTLESGKSVPVAVNDDPLRQYKNYFTQNLNTGLNLTNQDLISGKKRVIDFILGDLKKCESHLGHCEFQLLQEQIESIDALGKKLADRKSDSEKNGLPPALVCTNKLPDQILNSMSDKSSANAKWYHLEENLELVGEANRVMMAQAFACGNQLGLLQYGCGHSAFGFRFKGADIPPGEHHGSSHGKQISYRASQKAIISEVASLAKELKSIATPSGGSILDETAIFLSSCMGDADAHNGVNIPCFILGGKNFLKTGQYLNLGSSQTGSHNKLLTTIARALGESTTNQFGINVNKDKISGTEGIFESLVR